jgi:hypothetical protein
VLSAPRLTGRLIATEWPGQKHVLDQHLLKHAIALWQELLWVAKFARSQPSSIAPY